MVIFHSYVSLPEGISTGLSLSPRLVRALGILIVRAQLGIGILQIPMVP